MFVKYFTSKDDFNRIIKNKLKQNCEIKQIKSGWTNFVFEAKTSKKRYIFRFPRNNFFSDALVKEAKFSKFISKHINLKTPILNLCSNKKRIYSFHEKIEGHTLSSCMSQLSNIEMKKISRQLCDFLTSLQKTKYSYLQTTSCFLDNLSFVCGKKYNLNKHKQLKSLEQNKLVLCHGDFNPGNILLDENNNLIGVLDFAFVSKSHPICDISRLIERMPSDFNKIFLKICFEKFNEDFDELKIKKVAEMWKYVEKKYIAYIKENHKDIVFHE